MLLGDLALGAALVRRKNLTEEDKSTAFWLSAGIGTVLMLLGIVLAGPIASLYGQPRVEPLFRVISITFLVSALGLTQNALLVRDMRFRNLELRTVTATALSSGVAIGLALA